MHMVATVLTWTLLLAGAFFLLTGALGMVRLPDVFTRMHAAGMTDTMGAGLILLGLLVHTLAGGGQLEAVPVRLLLILGFLWFTSPIATHATAKAALSGGVRPFTLSGDAPDDAASGAAEPATPNAPVPNTEKGGAPS